MRFSHLFWAYRRPRRRHVYNCVHQELCSKFKLIQNNSHSNNKSRNRPARPTSTRSDPGSYMYCMCAPGKGKQVNHGSIELHTFWRHGNFNQQFVSPQCRPSPSTPTFDTPPTSSLLPPAGKTELENAKQVFHSPPAELQVIGLRFLPACCAACLFKRPYSSRACNDNTASFFLCCR